MCRRYATIYGKNTAKENTVNIGPYKDFVYIRTFVMSSDIFMVIFILGSVLMILVALAFVILPWCFKKVDHIVLIYGILMGLLAFGNFVGAGAVDMDNEHRLKELGFVWNGEQEGFANVNPEDMEEAQQLYDSQMGIGFPAKAMVMTIALGFVLSVIYWLEALLHWLLLRHHKSNKENIVSCSDDGVS